MADDLRERILRGDLAALTDPALPLHLLADGPTAAWWREGAALCAFVIVRKCLLLLEPDSKARVLTEVRAWRQEERWSGKQSLVVPVEGDPRPHLDLALRLRAVLPAVPPEVDAALDALERYAR